MTKNILNNQNELTLNVSELTAGYYIVKVSGNDAYSTKNIQIIR